MPLPKPSPTLEGVLFFGHIATSLLLADATRSDRAAAVVGNLAPDVIDKTGAWVLRVMPAARWIAHGLPFFALASLLAFFVLDGRRWRGFVLGYGGHLVCDLWAGGRVPWLAPFQKPQPKRRRNKRGLLFYLLPEFLGLPLIWRRLRPDPLDSTPDPAARGR